MTDGLDEAQARQQQAIDADAPLFVEACPGAGKTHVIVSRHLRQTQHRLRGGRALISFTRTARDQMQSRCAAEGHPELGQFPHFIGTLDSFIWQFLVAPYRAAGQPGKPLESWGQLPKAAVTVNGRDAPLSAFTFTLDLDRRAENVVQPGEGSSAAPVISTSGAPWVRWARAVIDCRDRYRQEGYLTGHEIRMEALRNLRTNAPRVITPLRSRFHEVIIDEAQDCSVADIAILTALHHNGIPLVVVADPDQAIYGWKPADPQRLRELRDTIGNTIVLNGNRRSTPPICALAAILRTGNRPPDISVVRTEGPEVHLVPTKFGQVGKAVHAGTGQNLLDVVIELADKHCDTDDPPSVLVLARRHSHLPPAFRRGDDGTNPITRLARAKQCIDTGTTNLAELEQACGQAEQILLAHWYPDHTGSVSVICETVGLSAPTLRRHAYAFLHTLPTPTRDWTSAVQTQMKSTWRPHDAAPPTSRRGLPSGKVTSLGQPHQPRPNIRITTIHQAKGGEADVVCVLLKDADLINRWLDGAVAGEESEELRVLYVAVTRARDLLILAIPEEFIPALEKFLACQGSPATVHV